MKTKIESSESLMKYCEKLPEELNESANNLITSEQTRFKEIKKEDLEAIAFPDDFYIDEKLCWKAINLHPNPLVSYQTDFITLNPNKQGKITKTKKRL